MIPLFAGDLRLRSLGVLTAVCLALAGLGSWTRAPDPALAPQDATDAVDVWILDNGFHTDLALPRDRLEAGDDLLARAVRALPSGDWILVGWGDARPRGTGDHAHRPAHRLGRDRTRGIE